MIRNSLCLALCSLVGVPLAFAHEGHQHGSQSGEKPHTARGIVFDDRDRDGTHDESEPGIADIRVSNGRDIVQTDTNGRYELKVDDDDIVFVIKPRDWQSPLSNDQLPQFYYVHKPAGSPKDFRFAGVAPTGPLPASIDFPLHPHPETDQFKAILFGDPQPRTIKEVEYIAHDVVEQIIAEEAHGASLGVTLGDIVFDDLSLMQPLNQAIALIGIPWYNVIGNHDLNFEAATDDLSDETFERIYGPSYYSFEYGPAHFLVLDNVVWVGAHDGQKGKYHAGLGPDQLEFIRKDLELIPPNQLVVLLMHIPLGEVQDRQDLYRLIEKRPATVSVSAHTHYMEHRLIGSEDGWQGPQRHHHIVNVTVSGSWWRGNMDERGIPHATMSDGGPNGYSILEFDGNEYALKFRAAGRPADFQMLIHAPNVVSQAKLAATVIFANVFNGSEETQVAMRVDRQGEWMPMERKRMADPAFVAEKAREDKLGESRTWQNLPGAHATPHLWNSKLPSNLDIGTHLIEVRSIDRSQQTHIDHRVIRVSE